MRSQIFFALLMVAGLVAPATVDSSGGGTVARRWAVFNLAQPTLIGAGRPSSRR
jgi:hypothetical protein